MNARLYFWASLCLLVLIQSCASEPSGNESGETDSDKKEVLAFSPSDTVGIASKYLLPSPSEVLGSLQKLGNVQWDQVASFSSKSDYPTPQAQAVNLGIRVADALVAINAQDIVKFSNMSLAVSRLSKTLGIDSVINKYSDNLAKLAAQGKWAEMGAIMDNIQIETEQAIKSQGKTDLVVLASIGGWLEGLKVVSGHLKTNYTAENTPLLSQRELISYYLRELDKLDADTKAASPSKDIISALLEINLILSRSNEGVLSQQDVDRLSEISNNLLKTLQV